jgi:hypothetical protein
MVLIALGTKIKVIDAVRVSEREIADARRLQATIQPYLFDGWVLSEIDPVVLARETEVLRITELKLSSPAAIRRLRINQTGQMLQNLARSVHQASKVTPGCPVIPYLPMADLIRAEQLNLTELVTGTQPALRPEASAASPFQEAFLSHLRDEGEFLTYSEAIQAESPSKRARSELRFERSAQTSRGAPPRRRPRRAAPGPSSEAPPESPSDAEIREGPSEAATPVDVPLRQPAREDPAEDEAARQEQPQPGPMEAEATGDPELPRPAPQNEEEEEEEETPQDAGTTGEPFPAEEPAAAGYPASDKEQSPTEEWPKTEEPGTHDEAPKLDEPARAEEPPAVEALVVAEEPAGEASAGEHVLVDRPA